MLELRISIAIVVFHHGCFARKNIALFVGLPVPMKRKELVKMKFVVGNQPLGRPKLLVASIT
jgi:hypothetical protein